MASSGFNWTPMCSMTAVKYQRYGFVEMRPFLPGERKRACKEMERNMKGYRGLRQEMAATRKIIKEQEEIRRSTGQKTIHTSFYKSTVGTRLVEVNLCFFFNFL